MDSHRTGIATLVDEPSNANAEDLETKRRPSRFASLPKGMPRKDGSYVCLPLGRSSVARAVHAISVAHTIRYRNPLRMVRDH